MAVMIRANAKHDCQARERAGWNCKVQKLTSLAVHSHMTIPNE